MRTTFGSFNIANSGLFASRKALDVTSHNIANANTEGYSRQIHKQRASLPIWGDTKGITGTGVEIYNIERIRNEYLDKKYWNQNRAFGEWQIKQESLEKMEAIFNEPSDTGIRQAIDEFFLALDELSKKTGDSTSRVAVVERANILARTINRNGNEIITSIREANEEIKSKVDQINSIASQIAVLNKQIFNMELGDSIANDLRDQRNVLIDKLSKIIDIEVSTNKDKHNNEYLSIKIGGITLVEHLDYYELDYVQEDVPGVTDLGAGKIAKIVWKGLESQEVKVEGGELRGLLDIRDGDGEGLNYRGLVYYLNKLNEFARDFSNKINEIHRKGYDFNGEAGRDFFNVPKEGPNAINCLNFAVNAELLANPDLIAASSEFSEISNNNNLKDLIALKDSHDMFASTKGTPDDFIKALLSSLAVDAQQAKRMAINSEMLVVETDNRRMSVSGVLLDEEMGNMVKFSQAYNAAARMITTLDSILDTTINRLGMVGR
ncbi:MAG: flagellar hook-associated protein FlgK [Clostridiales bacterium]|nr:flagellar hook-associated protein FlgK [Clostridiales bacterium]